MATSGGEGVVASDGSLSKGFMVGPSNVITLNEA